MLYRALVYLLALYVGAAPVQASQNALSSPTTGTVSGLQLTNNYNNALDSVNTCNSGTSAPTNQLSASPSAGNCWMNTTASPYPYNIYDGANWVPPFWIDSSNHWANVKIGGGTASIASASTVDLCSGVTQNYITVTGTASITSFGSTCPPGQVKFLKFSAAATITYNATSLIVPGAANIIAAAGDQATAISLGSGNWQISSYTPASGQAIINPSIDVGAMELTFSPNIPSAKYLWAYGQSVSRATYATLLTALTVTQSVTATNGSPTLTGFSDTTQICSGSAAIEATFVPNGSLIQSCTSTTVTMNNNATASTTGNVTVFPYGNGCGFQASCASPSTVFNLPDCRGSVLAGRDNMGGTARNVLTSTYFGVTGSALGSWGGSQSSTVAQTNLPSVNFPVTSNSPTAVTDACVGNFTICTVGGTGLLMEVGNSGGGGTTGAVVSVSTISGQTAASGGGGVPLSNVQPTLTMNCMIRVLAFLEPGPGLPNKLAVNDDLPPAVRAREAA